MQYTIHNEPDFSREVLRMCTDMANGASVQHQIDMISAHRGAAASSSVAEYFTASTDLLAHLMANLPLADLEFLFKLRGKRREPLAGIFGSRTIDTNVFGAILAYALDEKPSEHWQESDFIDILDEHNLELHEKYDMVKLCYGFKRYHAAYRELLKRGSELIMDKLPDFAPAIANCMDFVAQQMGKRNRDFIKEILRVVVPEKTHCEIYPAIYDVNSCAMTPIRENHTSIYIGLHYFDIADRLKSRALSPGTNTRNFLKCISDATKFSILQMLKSQPMYGGQLAKELSLTTATISHHISDLVNARLIFLQKEGNRVYYHLDRAEVLREILGVQELFG